ncbi:MAG: hypothetical protein KKB62_03740 [Nanoarchaeota archaeon]|nr:hypothetical protein [Nanoarchaeota archaeon]
MKEVLLKSKKGQVTIFVIIALVIVVAGVLIYFFYPGLTSTATSLDENPRSYIQNCIENNLEENVMIVGLQGGSLEPSSYIIYGGNTVEYLCYTNENYKTCVPQRAALVSHIEKELKDALALRVTECFSQMRSDYTSRGYTVVLDSDKFNVNLLPDRVILHSNSTLTLTRASTERYDSFDVIVNNNLYELASIARNIVSWEEQYGDSDPAYFMYYYPHLKIEKKLQSDGSKIYIITERETGNIFQFAVRSVVWPLGASS